VLKTAAGGVLFFAFRKQFAHWPAISGADNNFFWIFAAKGLRDVAVPTNGQVRFEEFRQFLWRNFVPLHRLSVGPNKGGPVVMPGQLKKGLVAVGAGPAPVPVRDLRPHEAVLRIRAEFAEAFLAAALALGPAGTFAQVDLGTTSQRTARRISERYFHTSSFACFRTGE